MAKKPQKLYATAALLKEFLVPRHFVPLKFVTNGPGKGEKLKSGQRPLVCPGFIMAWRDRHLWITAGHIMEPINKMLAAGHEMKSCHLLDTLHSGGPPVPMPYDPKLTLFINNQDNALEDGLDFGCHLLPNNTASLLIAGGVIPLAAPSDEDMMRGFDQYAAIGLPLIHEKIVGNNFYVGLTIVNFEQNCSYLFREGKAPLIQCLMPDPLPSDPVGPSVLNSPEGMSGGPLFGLRRLSRGRWKAFIIGIIVGHRPDSKLLDAIPTRLVDEFIKVGVERLKRKAKAGKRRLRSQRLR